MKRSPLTRAEFWMLLGCALVAHDAVASPLIDPIVRVRSGGESIPIVSLPFVFSFGVFPTDPDGSGTDCSVNPYIDPAGTVVSCAFQNLSEQTISFLNVSYQVPGSPGALLFAADDPDNLFASENANTAAANFLGRGIPPGRCGSDGEFQFCVGGEFFVDVIGFPNGTRIDMTAATAAVPEPGSAILLVSGLAGLLMRRRRA